MKKRVLFISYFFPPVGGAGVQRAAKFVKYLPENGWDVSVLTAQNPSVPLFDHSLADELPAETSILKARTLEPSYALKSAISAARALPPQGENPFKVATKFALRKLANFVLQPDPQILWMPAAIREGKRLLRDRSHHAIVATAPPFSSFLVGARLSRAAGLPLILDYRDEWDISNAVWENKQAGWFARLAQGRMQQQVLRTASAVVATTRSSAAALQHVCDTAQSSAEVAAIYNGFDSDDFPTSRLNVSTNRERYRIAYVGTLWNLTSIEPLVEAIARLSVQSAQLAERLELVVAGRRTSQQDAFLDRLDGLPVPVVRQPYVDHASAVEQMCTADGLCLLLSDLPKAERVAPAKIFEYMASRRWILAVAPRGEVWDLLGNYASAALHTPPDIEGIARSIAAELQHHRSGGAGRLRPVGGSRFDRRQQAGMLAEVLERSLARPDAPATARSRPVFAKFHVSPYENAKPCPEVTT